MMVANEKESLKNIINDKQIYVSHDYAICFWQFKESYVHIVRLRDKPSFSKVCCKIAGPPSTILVWTTITIFHQTRQPHGFIKLSGHCTDIYQAYFVILLLCFNCLSKYTVLSKYHPNQTNHPRLMACLQEKLRQWVNKNTHQNHKTF